MIDKLSKYYEQDYNEDTRLIKDKMHSIEFLTTIRYFDKVFIDGSDVLDACAGTGIYSFHLAKEGHKVTAGDIIDHNVSIIKKKQMERPILKEIYTGGVLDLSRFEDESFDAVLCMGALYHLSSKLDREKAVEECLRILKRNGIFAASYINKHAVILNSFEDELKNIDELLNYHKDSYSDVFYGSTPKEINHMMDDAGLKKLYNIGTDGISYLIKSKINSANDKSFNKYLKFHFDTCEDKDLLGYSLHGLYLGIK
jgi:2-polyprenyl-3-methyl-5-hydroxy-6-metoxy-1,4-benzoquinol methylase